MFPGFSFFSGGGGVGDTFSLKLPRIPYQKNKIPICEDFKKIKLEKNIFGFL